MTRPSSRTRGGWPRTTSLCAFVVVVAVMAMGLVAAPMSALAEGPESAAKRLLDYNRDVRPILSDACFSCHGPDAKARKAELRLDERADATRDREGVVAIVPGDPDTSEAIFRVEVEDETLKMPPEDSGKKVTAEQLAVLRTWVEQGAEYKKHWAFLTPERSAIPGVGNEVWPRTGIDRFLLARIEAEGLSPSVEADKTTLIRRVTLDLTGLPPTVAEVDAFLADERPEAFEAVVDRLLLSPRFGEHMARFWLDAARYGDTHGLHLDNYREMWPYRDWVINAFNRNLPFDQFVVEQLAGDMLPEASLDQVIASGFNRAHVTTSEGGSINEEVFMRNVTDRVDTTGTVFLGLTVGCARCHDHKYDPLTTREYYGLYAVFNSLDDNPLDGNKEAHPPVVQVPSEGQKAELAKLDGELAKARERIAEALGGVAYDEAAEALEGEFVKRDDFTWLDDALPAPASGENKAEWPFVSGPDHPVKSGTASIRVAAGKEVAQQQFTDAKQLLKVGEGDVIFVNVFVDPVNPPRELMLQLHTDGWKQRAYWGENLIDLGKDGTPERLRIGDLPLTGTWVRLEVPVASLGLKPGETVNGLAISQHGGTVYWDQAGLFTWTPQPGKTYEGLTAWVRDQKANGGAGLAEPVATIIKLERAERKPAQVRQLREYFLTQVHEPSRELFKPLNAELAKVEAARAKLEEEIPTTLVSQETKEPRKAFLLDRGEYDRPKDEVPRLTPAFLPAAPAEKLLDRLQFARWLVSPEHPLTARVAVNRFWQQMFGTGLVKTADDFGAQGEPPSHPELLDWLAVEFRETGWDVKALVKLMAMSAAYRQEAKVTPEKLARDPGNRLLARGPRYRLDAESLRDQALFVSRLLQDTIGGPSVKPPQPAGLWEAVGYTGSNTATFTADTGAERVHRRSLYTFWKRTSAPPQMTTFDAPSREFCTVRRERTNTPLQALLLMNETQYVECARTLAQHVLKEGGSQPEDRLSYLFRTVAARQPDEQEMTELKAALDDFLAHFRGQTEAASELIKVGETKPDDTLDPAELAAWTMVGNLVLNLDEVVNK